MPLMTMTSDLSWYGNKPPGFTANANKQSTDFIYKQSDLTVSTRANGFNELGSPVTFAKLLVSSDAFPIDTALGDNGNAKRKAQRGAGSLFPIGPAGQIHQFDTKRTGWYIDNRYGDQFNNKTTAGLANTYTTNSPIDDMYNKYKVREEVYDPYGYAKTPYILRGIQQDGSSDPQRWGLGGTTAGVVSGLLDIPRGGPLTAGERIGLDVVRLGKFLIRPNGLAFIAKQQLLRLMSPNVEGIDGGIYKLNPQKIYNPVNTLLSAAGGALGLRFRNYGLLPVGGLSRYEDIHTARDIARLGETRNRLVRLNNQRVNPYISELPAWAILSGPMGPDSVGGIGFTDISKYAAYDTHRWYDRLEEVVDKKLIPQYDDADPYVITRSYVTGPPSPAEFAAASRPQSFIDSRDGKSTTKILSPYRKPSLLTKGKQSSQVAGTRTNSMLTPIYNSLTSQLVFHEYSIFNYGDISEILDRTTSYLAPYVGNRNNTNAPITNDTQVLTNPAVESENNNNFTLKKKAENNNFTGIPQKSPNPAKAEDRTPAIAKYKTLAYGNLGKDRRPGSTALLDFTTGKEYNVAESPMSKHVNTKNDKQFWLPENINHSLITLKIASVDFIAYLTNWSESNNGSVAANDGALGVYPTYKYSSYERTVSCEFIVAARSKQELATNWTKLKTLQRVCQPAGPADSGTASPFGGGAGSFWKPKLVNITIGDIYKNRSCIMTSCQFSVDLETPWEISNTQQVPYYITVSCEFTIVSLDGKSFGGFSIDPSDITNDLQPTKKTATERIIQESDALYAAEIEELNRSTDNTTQLA